MSMSGSIPTAEPEDHEAETVEPKRLLKITSDITFTLVVKEELKFYDDATLGHIREEFRKSAQNIFKAVSSNLSTAARTGSTAGSLTLSKIQSYGYPEVGPITYEEVP